MIQVDSAVYLFLSLLLLLIPLDWLLAAAVAALFHELCHMLVLYALGGRIRKCSIHVRGCVLETDCIGQWRQLLSILAGPLGSFILLFLCHCFPRIAVCGLLQGCYNILPVLPLDGGRLIRILLHRFRPEAADRILNGLAILTCAAAAVLAIWLSTEGSVGIWPILLILVWSIKVLPRKSPCKQPKIGVQ